MLNDWFYVFVAFCIIECYLLYPSKQKDETCHFSHLWRTTRSHELARFGLSNMDCRWIRRALCIRPSIFQDPFFLPSCLVNCCKQYIKQAFAANIFLFKVNSRNTRKRCEICSKITIKTTSVMI